MIRNKGVMSKNVKGAPIFGHLLVAFPIVGSMHAELVSQSVSVRLASQSSSISCSQYFFRMSFPIVHIFGENYLLKYLTCSSCI